MPKLQTPFGRWPSPITPAIAAAGSRRFGGLKAEAGAVYWTESRPEQGGRQTILQGRADGSVRDLLAAPFSARSRVHEYGGGEFTVVGETIYFTNDSDQQIYVFRPGEAPRRLTNAPNLRFADYSLDDRRQRLIGVGEQHGGRQAAKVVRNLLVAVDVARGRVTELAAAHDFYASACLSPAGDRIAFLAWDLPDMPWDSATLFVAPVHADGALGSAIPVAGGNGAAAFQPAWCGGSGHLSFVLDASGWGQLYVWDGAKVRRRYGQRGADLSRPQWVFGMRSYCQAPDGSIGAVALRQGRPLLEVWDPKRGRRTRYASLASKAARIDDPVAFAGGFAALISRPTAMPEVMRIGRREVKGFADPPARTLPLTRLSGSLQRRHRRCLSRRRAYRLWPLLCPHQRGASRARRSPAAGPPVRTWRSHQHDRRRLEAAHPVLHQSRLCRARHQLLAAARASAAPTASGSMRPGASPTWPIVPPPPGTWPRRPRRRRKKSPSPAAAPAATPP